MLINQHLSKLGYSCKDRISGFEGVITHIGFDLYGCIQAIVHPGMDEKGVMKDTAWFDLNRLEITSDSPVMDVPNFEFGHIAEAKQGPGEKPLQGKN